MPTQDKSWLMSDEDLIVEKEDWLKAYVLEERRERAERREREEWDKNNAPERFDGIES